MAVARRVYLYGIAFVALQMLVTGLAGLAQVGLAVAAQRIGGPVVSVGASDLRGAVSFSGALTAIGLVAWSIHWGLADRAVRRGDAGSLVERRSAIRRLFLYAVLLVGGLDLTFSGSGLVNDLARALLGRLTLADVVTGTILGPLARVVIVGVVWLYYARVARTDRQVVPEAGAGATLRRWCVYILSLVGLFLWLFAAAGLLQTLWEALVIQLAAAQGAGVTAGGWQWLAVAVAGRLGPLVAGLTLWLLAWRWSNAWFGRAAGPDPEGRSVLRKVYLYLVTAVAVAWTVWNGGRILHQLLRALLAPPQPAGGWWEIARELGSPVAASLVFGVAWLYHASVVQREAALAGERQQQVTIRWMYQYLVALVGAVTFAAGLSGTVATIVELLARAGVGHPVGWWQDRISLFVTLVTVGLPLWLAFWLPLQREAADPLARQSLARRIYLFLAFGLATLTLLGSGAFSLYQLMRLLLGERWTAGQTSDLIAAASAAAVAALLLIYHLQAFRRDAVSSTALSAPTPVVAVAVIHASRREVWQEFERQLKARAPSGVEVHLAEVEPATAEQVLRVMTAPSPSGAAPPAEQAPRPAEQRADDDGAGV